MYLWGLEQCNEAFAGYQKANDALIEFNYAAVSAFYQVAFAAVATAAVNPLLYTASSKRPSAPDYRKTAQIGDDVFDIVHRAEKAAYGRGEVQDFNKAERILEPVMQCGFEHHSLEDKLCYFYIDSLDTTASVPISSELSEKLDVLAERVWDAHDFIREIRAEPRVAETIEFDWAA